MNTDLDDVKFCYLFTLLAEDTSGNREKEFKRMKKLWELDEWDNNQFKDFKKQVGKQSNSETVLKQLNEMLEGYYGMCIQDESRQTRLLLWWLIQISFANGKPTETDNKFIQKFRESMKLDSSISQEFSEVLELESILDVKKEWGTTMSLTDDENELLQKEIAKDKKVLNTIVNDLVSLG